MITDINTLDFSKVYTYADYLTWKFQERVELIKGRIFKMSPAPARKHQEISGIMYREISLYLKKQKCKVYHAPFDVRFPNLVEPDKVVNPYTVVQPDICVICDLSKLDEQGCNGAPDLIIEILSPSSSKKDIKDKYELYEENGVTEYWIVFPGVEIIEVFTLNQNRKYELTQRLVKDDIATSTVLKEFSLDLNEVFEEIEMK